MGIKYLVKVAGENYGFRHWWSAVWFAWMNSNELVYIRMNFN